MGQPSGYRLWREGRGWTEREQDKGTPAVLVKCTSLLPMAERGCPSSLFFAILKERFGLTATQSCFSPCTEQMPFWKPNCTSFLTDSAKQQRTDLLRGLTPGLRLCHGRATAHPLSSSCDSSPHPRPWVLWLQSLFGHQMGLASGWMGTISLQMSRLLHGCFL